MNLDLAIFNKFQGLISQSVCFDSLVIFCAQDLIWILVGLSIVVCIFYRRQIKFSRIFFLSLGSFFLSYILLFIIQYLYFRSRPFVVLNFNPLVSVSARSASFPSSHTLLAFLLALVIYSFNKKWGIVSIVLASFVGLARIFAGVHWPFDILAGVIITILSFSIVRAFIKNINL